MQAAELLHLVRSHLRHVNIQQIFESAVNHRDTIDLQRFAYHFTGLIFSRDGKSEPVKIVVEGHEESAWQITITAANGDRIYTETRTSLDDTLNDAARRWLNRQDEYSRETTDEGNGGRDDRPVSAGECQRLNPYASPKSMATIAERGTLRTDKTSGKITTEFGIVMVVFATFGLMIVALQQAMFFTMPAVPPNPKGPAVIDGMRAIHGVWLIYLPAMIAGGIIYAVAGFHVQRGSLAARRVAQANAIGGYIWVIAYSISCYQISDVASPPPDMLPESARIVLQWLLFVLGALFAAAFPTGLLFVLSRPIKKC